MSTLAARNLSFDRPNRRILHDICLAVEQPRVVALVGASGSGKTTLLWLMAGLLPPSSGRVTVGNAADSTGESVNPRRHRIGMVFQQPALWEHLTAAQHLDLVLRGRNLDAPARRAAADRILSRTRLDHLRHRRPGSMSGGEQQRLAIARALVTQPDWLFLDEPLAHLDGPTRAEVFELLRDNLRDHRAGVILATHDPSDALRIADDAAVMIDGRIVQQGPASDVYLHPVNLTCALAMGPASELTGQAIAVLEGLPSNHAGTQTLILRPESLAFRPAPDGPAEVSRCEHLGGRFLLQVTVAAATILVASDRALTLGARGRLVFVGP